MPQATRDQRWGRGERVPPRTLRWGESPVDARAARLHNEALDTLRQVATGSAETSRLQTREQVLHSVIKSMNARRVRWEHTRNCLPRLFMISTFRLKKVTNRPWKKSTNSPIYISASGDSGCVFTIRQLTCVSTASACASWSGLRLTSQILANV